jgi:hypothetical protein
MILNNNFVSSRLKESKSTILLTSTSKAFVSIKVSSTSKVIYTMCDNSNLSYKGKPINRFFNSEDKVHLILNGTSMFAANIRDSIDSVLELARRLLHDAKSSRLQNSRYQDDSVNNRKTVKTV